MIFLGDLKETNKENILKVNFIHYCPFDKKNGLNRSIEELEQEGILIENIPEAELREGYNAEIRLNKKTSEVFYEYIKLEEYPTELIPEQRQIKELQNKIDEQEQAILELTNLVTGGNHNV